MTRKRYNRILAVAPCSRGFGFALLEQGKLIESGLKTIRGENKNERCIEKIEGIIAQYQPEVLALEDTGADNSRRMPRIRDLSQSILAVSLRHKVPVAWFTIEEIRKHFFADRDGTKHEVAQNVAKHFPELEDRLPRERRLWDSQDARIDLFHAVALALVEHSGGKRD